MKKLLAICTFLFVITINISADARTRADITTGTFEPIPIAIPDFGSSTAEGREVGRQIKAVIANNLRGTGMFRILNESSFVEQLQPGLTPRFESWSQIGAQGLVAGNIKSAGATNEIEFRLFDVLAGQQISGTAYRATQKGLRRIAHQISDQIYSRLTGEGPYFDTRIVYVSEFGPKNRRIKRLAIMDQDGANHQYITDGRQLVLTPRFAGKSQRVIYLSYANNKPRVRTLEIETGRETLVGDFPGMTFAPRFNDDGSRLLLSVAKNGNTDIYELDMRSRAQRQLTSGGAIETSPFYSPDGNQIVYSSDIGGNQALYIMNRDGSGSQQLTFGKGNYSTPVWSPRGDYIAFTKQANGQFYIGVLRPDGSGERLLTSSFLDEGPSWSPNGRVIIFTRQDRSGRSLLRSIDVTGYNERIVPTPGDASDPTWSPLLQ
jgi:TolB protein